MVFKLLVLLAALVGMVMPSATGPIREEGHAAANPDPDDPAAGFRAFGRVVSGFTILAALVFLVLVVLMFLSLFGVFENDSIDPPV
jgi:hypothetical protein